MKQFAVFLVVALLANSINGFDLEILEPKHAEPIGINYIGKDLSNGRITNGLIADHGQFPYQVGLSIDVGGGKSAWCGGSLISNEWILTAAHCSDVALGITVVLGAQNISNLAEPEQQRIFIPKKHIYVHEQWNPSTLLNDIALLKLPAPINFNQNIQAIALPKWNDTNDYAGVNVVASGWGKDSDASKTVSPVLRYVEIPVMGNLLCNLQYFGVIKSTHVCIKTTGGKSTCNGDSGGPLATTDKPPTLIGATSFGISLGCEIGWPGVFTRISSYLDWIHEKSGVINN